MEEEGPISGHLASVWVSTLYSTITVYHHVGFSDASSPPLSMLKGAERVRVHRDHDDDGEAVDVIESGGGGGGGARLHSI